MKPLPEPKYSPWAALASAGAGLATGLVNAFSQHKENKRQEAWTREQFDYNKQLNAEIFAREDSAYQRAVKDAQLAGLSPLAINGGAGAGGSASQSNLGMNTQAVQMEPNSFQDAIRIMADQSMQERQIKAQSESQEKQQSFEMMRQSAAYDAQDKMLDKQLEHAKQLADDANRQRELDRIQAKKIFNATQRNIYEAKNLEERMAASAEGKKAAAAIGVKNFEVFTNWEEYQAALKTRTAGAQARANDSWAMTQGYDESNTQGGTSELSANASASAGIVDSVGVKAGVGTKEGGSSSSTLSSSAVQHMNQAEAAYWNKTGYPVFVGEHHHQDI